MRCIRPGRRRTQRRRKALRSPAAKRFAAIPSRMQLVGLVMGIANHRRSGTQLMESNPTIGKNLCLARDEVIQ